MALGYKGRGIFGEYLALSHKQRMDELERVKKRKDLARKNLTDLTMRESTLKDMPDVAEELIASDNLATAIFIKLREMEGKTYSEFYLSSGLNDIERHILTHWIMRCQTAELLDYSNTERIQLTKKGHAFKYDGRFD